MVPPYKPPYKPPYDQPGAKAAFWALVGLFAAGEYLMQFRSLINRRGRRAERWSLLVVVITVVGGLVAGLAATRWRGTRIGDAAWVLFGAGLALMTAGLFIRQWAIFSLGRFFTADVRVHAGQRVVDRGPYRWVRHPSYAGLIVFFVGLGLAVANCASLAILAILPTVGLIVRIRAEERALLAGLGDDYSNFAASRRRLLPGVW